MPTLQHRWQETGVSENSSASMAGKKMLVVDDDAGSLLLAEQYFLSENFSVVTSLSGEDALSRLEEINPDIILLDLIMPDIDGFEVCRRIKRLNQFRGVPILIVTSAGEAEAAKKAYELGAWDFIEKPVYWPTLKYRVLHALRAATAFASERLASRLHKVINQTKSEVLVFLPNSLEIIDANVGALNNLGYDRADLGKLSVTDIISNDTESSVPGVLQQARLLGQEDFDFQMDRRNGTTFHATGTILFSTEEQPPVFIAVYQDTQERDEIEEELHRIFYYDDITSLPNQRLLKLHTSRLLIEADRNNSQCSVFMIQLSGLTEINNNLGHVAGDLVLRTVSDRLGGVVRKLDLVGREDYSNASTLDPKLARYNDNEFTIVLSDIKKPIETTNIASRILDEICAPYSVGDTEVYLTARIGIALYPDDGTEFDELIQYAHRALKQNKLTTNSSGFTFYSEEDNQAARERFRLQAELRAAIEHGELELHYQPQVDGDLQQIVGAEGLLRWQHPDGMRYPNQFIPVAEAVGIISEINVWVLREAISQLNCWIDKFPPDFRLSINISGIQLKDKEFLQSTQALLDANPRVRRHLVFELTESTLIEDIENTSLWLRELQRVGVEISIDDFGTGYSSLSYLARLPIDYLKVDQSFTQLLAEDVQNEAIVLTIFQLGRALGIKLVAEGVETETQLNILRSMGDCDIQGWLVCKAIPAAEFESFTLSFPTKA